MTVTSFVPSTRLLVLGGAIATPAALLAILPGFAALGYGIIAGLALLAIFDALGAPHRLDGISVRTPDIVRLWKDRPATFDVTIRNPGQKQILLRIGLPFPIGVATPDEELSTILPAATEFSRISWICTPRQRGQYLIDRCAIQHPSKLAFWTVRKMLPLHLEIRVYPNLVAEREKSPAFFKRGRLGVHGQRQLGKGKEFEKLREYASGDGYDEIDWKATARRGHPITRVFQIERTQEIYIILDSSRLSARPVSGDPDATILERSITASLLLALAAEKQGDLFGLITFSDRIHNFVRARNGKAHYAACRDALYTLQPRLVAPDFDELFSLLRLRLRRRALLIFLTELDDPTVSEAFVRNVPLLRQHLMLVGMAKPLDAQTVFGGSDVVGLDDIYRKLAGHVQWNKLRILGSVLASKGVRFSLLDADTLGPQLAALYVDFKQRQLL